MTAVVKTRVRLVPWLLLLTLAALVLLPAAARASGDGGDKQAAGADKTAAQADPQLASAEAAAEADPTIAAVLAGKDATVESAQWGGTEAQRGRRHARLSLGRDRCDEPQRGVAAAALGRRHSGSPV